MYRALRTFIEPGHDTFRNTEKFFIAVWFHEENSKPVKQRLRYAWKAIRREYEPTV